jgi:hypothetical protein
LSASTARLKDSPEFAGKTPSPAWKAVPVGFSMGAQFRATPGHEAADRSADAHIRALRNLSVRLLGIL